ncbi:protein-glutamine glutaminase family protein [Bdellovibrionota bacterium FG-1]
MKNQIRIFAGISALALALALTAIASPAVQASVVKTRVFRVEAPQAANGLYEVLSTGDGRVYFIAPEDRALVEQVRASVQSRRPVQLVLDSVDEERVIAVNPLSGPEGRHYSDTFDDARVVDEARDSLDSRDSLDGTTSLPRANTARDCTGQTENYTPTVLSSMNEAQELFRSERELKHHSQCYERAHVWAREFEQFHGVKSMKVFMFFTSLLRHRFTSHFLFWDKPYKWWFHVAPFVYVGSEQVVLDREFLGNAVPMEDWTFEFIGKVHHDNHKIPNPSRGEAHCQDAIHSSEFSQDPNPSRYCVLRKVPMYDFQPLDVEARDNGQSIMSNWRFSDLKRAYDDTK